MKYRTWERLIVFFGALFLIDSFIVPLVFLAMGYAGTIVGTYWIISWFVLLLISGLLYNIGFVAGLTLLFGLSEREEVK